MLEIIIVSVLGLCFAGFILLDVLFSIDKRTKSKSFCNVLKWHKDPEIQESDGINHFGECPRCHRTVYKDKSGHWKVKS
jgi:hypothetical protein